VPTVGVGIGVVEVVGLAPSSVTSSQSITPAQTASGAVAFGPQVSQPTVVPSVFTARVFRRTAPSTLIVELDESFDRSFQDQLSNPGSGSLSVMNDDPDLALVLPGDLIRMYVNGVNAWTMLARDFDRVSLAPGEEADQFTVISGPGHLAMFDEAVMYPALGLNARPIEEDRTFNWSSLGYDDSGWAYANALVRQDGTSLYYTGLPDADWPDPTAYWIWGTGNLEIAAPGHCYFRHEFTVPAGVSKLLIYVCADAQADVFFDGARLITTTFTTANPTETRTAVVDVTPGTHLIAVNGLNDPDPENDGLQNPGGFLLSAFATDTLGAQGALITNSTSSWRLADYPPSPPGMTPGEVIRVAVEEAQARSALPGITLGFNDVTDSDGVPWSLSAEIATKVGTSVLSFFEELAGTYVDIWMSPQLVLHAWVRGGRGTTRSASYAATTDPATSNLAGLIHKQAI